MQNHHGEIDRQPETWPVDRLQRIKSDHEAWVKGSLQGFDRQRQSDDEVYAGYIDEWSRRCHLDNWTGWTSALLSFGQPSLDSDIEEVLKELPRWIMKRVWPGRYTDLEAAFQNFGHVLTDLLAVFHKHAEKPHADGSELRTKKFYQIDSWDEEKYHRLHRQFEYHVDLVEDLTLELTRAANLVCDLFRVHILASFRLGEGRLSIMSGPHEDLTWKESVIEYNEVDRSVNPPYPGLSKFLIARASRDMHFGEGEPPK